VAVVKRYCATLKTISASGIWTTVSPEQQLLGAFVVSAMMVSAMQEPVQNICVVSLSTTMDFPSVALIFGFVVVVLCKSRFRGAASVG